MSVANTLLSTRFGKLLERNLDGVSFRAFKGKKKPEWKGPLKSETGTGHLVRYQHLRGFKYLNKVPENGDIPIFNTSQGYTYEAVFDKFAGGFRISEELMEDNRYLDLAKAWATQLGDSARQTKEWEAVRYFNLGHSTFQTPDEVAWFSTAHKGEGGINNLSNTLSVAMQWSEEAWEAIKIGIENMQLDTGLLADLEAEAIVCKDTLKYDVYRVINADKQPNTFSNNPNAGKAMDGVPTVYTMRRLAHPGRVYVKTSDEQQYCMVQRKAWKTKMIPDYHSQSVIYLGSERYKPFVKSWSSYFSNGAVV